MTNFSPSNYVGRLYVTQKNHLIIANEKYYWTNKKRISKQSTAQRYAQYGHDPKSPVLISSDNHSESSSCTCLVFFDLFRSPSRMTTIHAQIASRHKAACVAEQKDRSTSVLLWTRQTAQHVLFRPLLSTLGELLEEILYHLCHDVAGRNGVDTDVVLAPFGRQVASKLNDSSFAGIVSWTNQALRVGEKNCQLSSRQRQFDWWAGRTRGKRG